jgi:hypothetical protein
VLLPAIPANGTGGGQPRILIVGDSRTHGWDGDYTWRYRLWREFERQRVSADFVGSKSLPYLGKGYTHTQYADPDFDRDHFAQAGATLHGQVQQVGPEVARQQPDLVIVASGLNDLLHGGSVADLVQDLQTFIARVRGAKSHVSIVVADTTVGWNPSSAFAQDGIHFTPKAESLYANRIATELHTIGILPDSPAPVPASVPWVRDLRPTVRQSGRSVTATWDTEALTGARVLIRRHWRPAHTVTTTAHQVRFSIAPGAVYDLRVQGLRHSLTSTWSSVVSLRAMSRVAHVRVRAAHVSWSPVKGATWYDVKYRPRHTSTWRKVDTDRLSIHARAVVATVTAHNNISASPASRGRR